MTIFQSMQKKECWVLDGHQELGHVSLTGNVEEDMGSAASRQHLQERRSSLTGRGWGKERMVGCVEESKEAVPGFHN